MRDHFQVDSHLFSLPHGGSEVPGLGSLLNAPACPPSPERAGTTKPRREMTGHIGVQTRDDGVEVMTPPELLLRLLPTGCDLRRVCGKQARALA